ncbi:hypothetical protein [Microvirga ossetica]|uniref:5'-methylthioadenosine/S-adenosylhomocysteine nucleosidase family protein n=1 Tax=Microvirga ossetica TaxID=1882682 RepID=UPI000C161211|nr:hypothetical protein [Microvirga ossetica]
MTTGILCATPEELDALHHRFEFDGEPTTLAGFQFWKGNVPDRSRPIVLSQSGIGKVNAATLATILFTTFGWDDLIFSGVAGALTDLEVGSVVLVTKGATMTTGSSAMAFSPASQSVTSRYRVLPSLYRICRSCPVAWCKRASPRLSRIDQAVTADSLRTGSSLNALRLSSDM